MEKYTIEYITNKKLILLDCISGSHAYGLNHKDSDLDKRGIYICEEDDFFLGKYPEQITDEKNDIIYYELSKFISLLRNNNPNILELLNIPDDCIVYKNSIFDSIIENKNEFISMLCKNSFGGYANQQIKKAIGLDKKQNWEKDRVVRKDILDFCYVIDDKYSIPFKKWNDKLKYDISFFGVSKVPNARDLYYVFYDLNSSLCYSKKISKEERENNLEYFKLNGIDVGFGFKGIVNVDDENESNNYGISNQLRLSSIPTMLDPVCIISFNKDGYSEHCKDYKSYTEWLEKRNVSRYVTNKKHGQKYDSKNLMHCSRLLRMCDEISQGKGIIVRRPDREELLDIRNGNVNLKDLIDKADSMIREMFVKFENSNLPKYPNNELLDKLYLNIRKSFYGKK